jgi:hypothetical protein
MGMILANSYPRLASFSISVAISVQEVLQAADLDTIFTLPLSQQAMHELEQLQDDLADLNFDENLADQWQPIWGKDYTAKRFYDHIYDLIQAHPIFQIVWNSNCTPRIKFFIWLVLVDRLNTKTMLTRRHIGARDDDHCVMCSLREDGTIEHLFFTCSFAVQCWNRLNFTWDLSLNLEDRLSQARQYSGLQFFTEAAMIAAWELWKIRNDKIFNRSTPSQDRWFYNFKNQCMLQSARFKADLRSAFCFWLDAFT